MQLDKRYQRMAYCRTDLLSIGKRLVKLLNTMARVDKNIQPTDPHTQEAIDSFMQGVAIMLDLSHLIYSEAKDQRKTPEPAHAWDTVLGNIPDDYKPIYAVNKGHLGFINPMLYSQKDGK